MSTTPTSAPKKRATPRPAASASAAAKRRALSLHIGLNKVDPGHYAGWDGELFACEADAADMQALALSKGLKPTVLLGAQASRAAVLKALRAASGTLKSGDYFLLTFSGHGGQVPDTSGEEVDRLDETWCLWDGQLIDDELYLELSRFAAGVRVLVLSDSCHSGTVTRAAPASPPVVLPGQPRPRLMPRQIARKTYRDHQDFYDRLQQEVAAEAARSGGVIDPDAALAQVRIDSSRLTGVVTKFLPSVILISGCQDNQTSMDGEFNGAFTGRLLEVWNQGRFGGNHTQFRHVIVAGMEPTQTPNLYTLGPCATFLAQKPFTV